MNYILALLLAMVTAGGVAWYSDAKIQQSVDALDARLSTQMDSAKTDVQQKFGSFSPTGGQTYRLASSIGSSNTTVKLSSFKEPVSNIAYTMTYLNSSIEYATIDPQTTRSEFISFTGISQNSDGSATLSGVTRGLTRTPQGNFCTSSSTLAQSHPGQSAFILSNSPCFYAEYTPLRNAATSSAILIFGSTTPPRLDSPAAQSTGTYIATTSEFATIAYVNQISISGTSNATESVKGISELGTALEAASSTILGGTSAGLVMQTKNATDTPQSGCASGFSSTAGSGCSVIAQLTGKIRQTFLNLAESYTWTAAHIFSSTVTFNGAVTATATSTLATTTISTGARVFNNNIANNYTAGETITGASTPVPVSFSTTTSRVFRSDGDVASTTNFIGFAVNSSIVAGTAYVQTDGVVSGFSGLTSGAKYFVSDTVGTLAAANTPGTFEIYVGYAVSATAIMLDHGPASYKQYLGSGGSGTTCTAVPDWARFADVNLTGANGTRDLVCEFSLSRYGKTSGSCLIDGDGVATVSQSASWSGSVITGAGNATAISCNYFR